MPPRIPISRSLRACRFHFGISEGYRQSPSLCFRTVTARFITADEKPLPTADTPGPGPNQNQLPHVSEEAAAIGKITGEGGPELEQGTPVQEILQRDGEAWEKAPQVLKDSVKPNTPSGSRQFSTSTRRRQESMLTYEGGVPEAIETSGGIIGSQIGPLGHKFGLPELPIPSTDNMKHRYDPVVVQFTNLMMKDGKLSVAQTNMARILNLLRTSSPPVINPDKPLMPNAPPASHLPLNPILYLTLAIDSVAPLLRLRSQKGAAGGGVALQIPVPLGGRQRRRIAIQWILDAATKRKWNGSGKGSFAHKITQEIISIVEGKSGLWERRGGIHRLAVSARSNLRPRRR